ncbi:MAG: C40 family peptidase [Gemmatimonadaceae bacterium]|nr:C40 family peptidase [Gemmatimonadaceae bacterium]
MSPETFSLVRAAVAPLLAEPKASSEQVSQSVAGHLAVILEVREGWRRVRLADGYEGWMHEGYLDARPRSAGEAREWNATARHSLGCKIYDDIADTERTLPLGARVARDAKIVAGGVLDEAEIRRRYPPVGIEICASAARYYWGTSYQWGGITPWGADCSGMVQTVFELHGAALPRDARQQAELGVSLELVPEAWRAGDLLFFSDRADGCITHVGIVAQQRTLMHVAIGRGGFAVEHLDGGAAYTAALMGRLRAARRVL